MRLDFSNEDKTTYAAIIYVRADRADVPKLVCTTVTLLGTSIHSSVEARIRR